MAPHSLPAKPKRVLLAFASAVASSAGESPVANARAVKLPPVQKRAVSAKVVPLKPVRERDIQEVELLLKTPTLTRYRGSHGRDNVELFLALGLDREQVAKMFNRRPSLCVLKGREILLPKLAAYQQHGLSVEGFLQGACKWPPIFTLGNEKVINVCKYLSGTLGVDTSRVMRKCPQMLGITVATLQSKQAFLEGVGMEHVGRSLEQFPSLLVFSLETLPSKVSSLRELAGFHDIGRVLSTHPQLLGMNIDTVRATHGGLVARFGRDSALAMFQKRPGILQRGWANMQEKLDFIQGEMRRGAGELVESPAVLTTSLEGTMRPRFRALQERGLGEAYSLHTMFSTSKAHFAHIFGITLVGERSRPGAASNSHSRPREEKDWDMEEEGKDEEEEALLLRTLSTRIEGRVVA
eukprot:jgi/Mesen1/2217/ME000152S01302